MPHIKDLYIYLRANHSYSYKVHFSPSYILYAQILREFSRMRDGVLKGPRRGQNLPTQSA